MINILYMLIDNLFIYKMSLLIKVVVHIEDFSLLIEKICDTGGGVFYFFTNAPLN